VITQASYSGSVEMLVLDVTCDSWMRHVWLYTHILNGHEIS